MVTIKKIIPSQPLSAFSQAVPSSGGSFDVLAEAMKTGYDMLLPAAKKEMEERGAALGREMARQQIGNPAQVSMGSMGPRETVAATGFDWNRYAIGGAAARDDSFTKLDPEYASRVAAMISAADQELGPQALKITSAYRSPELQGQLFQDAVAKYGSEEAARKWVAPPGRSKHNAGLAVDFAGADGSLLRDPNSREAKWIKENAGRFGLDVPMSWEPWQVELPRNGGQGASQANYQPPTVIMDADGKLQSRMYSPLSHPLMQIGNAAAGVANRSEIEIKAAADVMDMSNQFALDPQGFRSAANAYIEHMVANAEDMFKGDIRASLTDTVEKRYLGMVEEKQRDTRQRAANSNMALIDRYREEYSQAITTGNQDEIERSRSRLDSVLKVRETLPGLSWTTEQSANELIRAEESGRKAIQAASDAQAKETKSQLAFIEKAQGAATGFDPILNDPRIREQFPDEWRAAAETKAFYDFLPSARQAPPSQFLQVVQDLEDNPVTLPHELDLARAARKEYEASAKAWDDSPIDQAFAVMTQKPPALPSLEQAIANPAIVGAALADRVKYGVALKESDYTDTARFFTKAERESLGQIFGSETPPEIKAMIAGQIVASAGPHAKQVFRELAAKDPVTFLAGSLMARGGDQDVALKAFRGQAKINAGLVSQPDKEAKQAAITNDVRTALAMLPNSEKLMGDTMEMAVALYAADAGQNGANAGDVETGLSKAFQEALGQSTDSKDRVTGGVQIIGGVPTILPPGVAGEVVRSAIQSGLGGGGFWQSLARGGGPSIAGDDPGVLTGANETGNSRVNYRRGEIPMLDGQPLHAKHADKVFLMPDGGNRYVMHILHVTGKRDTLLRADGTPFVIDLTKMRSAQ